METNTAAIERDVMDHHEQQFQEFQRQMEALHQNLRTVRHAINNNVAVIMAMAELSQRNPALSQKLSQLCLEKAPLIASAMASFSEQMENTIKMQGELAHST